MDLKPPERQIQIWEQGSDVVGEHLAAIKQECNYETLVGGEARIIFFGETHSNSPIHRDIQSQARNLRKAGVTRFLVEAPDSQKQRELFSLINSGDLSRIDETNVGPLSRTSRVQMIEALQHAGIEILPIDDPRQYDRETRESREEREEYITQRTEEITQKRKGKVVVLIGRHHADRGTTSAVGMLEARKRKCRTVLFTGGLDEIPTIVTRSAQKAGIASKKFMFQAKEVSAPFGGKADWLVHLPQQGQNLLDQS